MSPVTGREPENQPSIRQERPPEPAVHHDPVIEKAREKAEAVRRARKLARKKLQREGLLPMKPKPVFGMGAERSGAGGRGGAGAGPRGPR